MAGLFNKYFGIRFQASDGIHYGWIRMSNDKTIADYAYQTNPEVPILTGEFDEADTLEAKIIVSCIDGYETLTANNEPSYLIKWLKDGAEIQNAIQILITHQLLDSIELLFTQQILLILQILLTMSI
jgi:hypothetical protein